MRYLTSARINKEDIREYIGSTRKQLIESITRNEKQKNMESMYRIYEEEKARLNKARESFDDDC